MESDHLTYCPLSLGRWHVDVTPRVSDRAVYQANPTLLALLDEGSRKESPGRPPTCRAAFVT
jgi:hypothetical protein